MKSKLHKILHKKKMTAIGLLSGTSVDAIDAALVQISDRKSGLKVKVIDFRVYPVSDETRKLILKNSDLTESRIDKISTLNVLLGNLFAEAAVKLCKKNSINIKDIDFIGSHGQTIHHMPQTEQIDGYNIKSTLQIGDPSVIANLSSITTVGDFRIADCASDGSGAPLVPYMDFILFRSNKLSRALLNIGGISNITLLPKGCSKDKVIAFDTGPGNMLVDGLMKKLYNKSYDKNGKTAFLGKLNNKLFKLLNNDKYYKIPPPKSTGREHYSERSMQKILKTAVRISPEDIIRTISEFTVYTIFYNYDKFIKPVSKIDELIISGGGANNLFLIQRLKELFKDVKIKVMNENGITQDSKEAVLFAILGYECLKGNPANMKQVTGSKKDVILGKICQA